MYKKVTENISEEITLTILFNYFNNKKIRANLTISFSKNSMIKQVYADFRKSLSKRVLDNRSRRFYNNNVTLLCNNCIGGIILHDLKQKFNTPTINLYFHAPDYIAFLERLEFYLNAEITFSNISKYDAELRPYPVGKIDDIEMHFVHYHNAKEAKEKWEARVKRVNFENIFIIGSDRDHCTPEIINRFLKLPYKNKIFFSSKKSTSPEIIFFKAYSDKMEVGDLIDEGHSWYFHFDVVRWLNTGQVKRWYVVAFLFNINGSIKRLYKKINRSQEKYERSLTNPAPV